MNVIFISQCDKRALTETRRVLDQFAERRGTRTWQTTITQAGLETLHRLLRQSARKNTAVTCHWVRGINRTELLWIVGDRTRFNQEGAVPTNHTSRNIIRASRESSWESSLIIQLLADLSGLFHDFGKSIDAFQQKLVPIGNALSEKREKNIIRHEWVSLRIFQAFVGNGKDVEWLSRLADGHFAEIDTWYGRLERDGVDTTCSNPFQALAQAPLASSIAWLIVTHHRLPVPSPQFDVTSASLNGILSFAMPDWNERNFRVHTLDEYIPYWTFSNGFPSESLAWNARVKRIAKKIAQWRVLHPDREVFNDPFVMHVSRLCLMLADRYYSGLSRTHRDKVLGAPNLPLFANTLSGGILNQRLDEHLLGVGQHAASIARFLPAIPGNLPRLVGHRALKRRVKDDAYRWQDRAVDLVSGIRENTIMHGAFIVNIASTGCGKTLGNAKIANALAHPVYGMRCSFAMGLRTLTLQTGRSFQSMLNLMGDELAIRVGGSANKQLFEYHEERAEQTGSSSLQDLSDENEFVVYDAPIDEDPVLRRAFADRDISAMLRAPVLVCTIDHLTPATESQRGGRQIAPMLRLLTGDLVLDEPDDFDISDIPALTRLVHWTGLLGSRVILSSATMPPALLEGLFEAYVAGRTVYEKNRNVNAPILSRLPVQCVWVDENDQSEKMCDSLIRFQGEHQRFVHRRSARLLEKNDEPRRSASIVSMASSLGSEAETTDATVDAFINSALELHGKHHDIDPVSGKRVSFGLVRMANINPLFSVARRMFSHELEKGIKIHVCVYHSQHPLLIRSSIETKLDRILRRHIPDAVFSDQNVRMRLDSSDEQDQLFIVLGSPVTEVGRDHDYDWAVVEPSSIRSLIQLAGRVRRHRPGKATSPNIVILQYNLRHYRDANGPAFIRPGFEARHDYRLKTHDVRQLVSGDELERLDARMRICEPSECNPTGRLADLEHTRLRDLSLPFVVPAIPSKYTNPRDKKGDIQKVGLRLNASSWWNCPPSDSTLTFALQQLQPFRSDEGKRESSLVLFASRDRSDWELYQMMSPRYGYSRESVYEKVERSKLHRISADELRSQSIVPWFRLDYRQELDAIAEEFGLNPEVASKRFGVVTVPESDEGWVYHPVFGFSVNR